MTNPSFAPSNHKLETKQMLQPQQIVLVDSVLCITRFVPENSKLARMLKIIFLFGGEYLVVPILVLASSNNENNSILR